MSGSYVVGVGDMVVIFDDGIPAFPILCRVFGTGKFQGKDVLYLEEQPDDERADQKFGRGVKGYKRSGFVAKARLKAEDQEYWGVVPVSEYERVAGTK